MSEYPRLRIPGMRWVLALLVIAACDCGSRVRHAQPAIEVSPMVVDFGEVAVDSNITAAVKVRNRGLGVLALNEATLGGDAEGLELLSLLTTDCDGAELKQDSPPSL